jgi:hypothetical protein
MRTRTKIRGRSPEREALDGWIRADRTRHYYTRLREVFIQTFAEWFARATDPARVNETRRLEREWQKQASLLFDHPPPANPNRDWRNLNVQPQIVRVLRHCLRVGTRGKGRPARYPSATLRALDLNASDPNRWTWRSITNRLCNCGTREHPFNSTCQRNLRREVLLLKKYLKTLGIAPPRE